MRQLGLRALQRWFAAVVAHPSVAAVAVRSRAARAFLAPSSARGILRPSRGISPLDQLQIYNGGYLTRLIEAMQSDYGAVAHVVGQQTFHQAVAGYVQRYPSRHPNLNQLGYAFPDYLRSRRGLPNRAFVAELAALELAICRAFDAPEFTPLTTDALQAVAAETWPRMRLVTNPSLQLLATRYPVDVAFQAFKDGGDAWVPAVPKPRQSYTAVFRSADRVFRQRLDRPAFAVLGALVRGLSLSRALQHAEGDSRVGTWFQSFARDGLFVAIRPPRARLSTN